MIAEERATLVDGDRMTAELDARIVGDVRKLQRILDPADGTHRIPHTDEPRFALDTGHCRLEVASKIEIFGDVRMFRIGTPRALDRHHHADGVWNERLVTWPDQTVHVQQRCHRSDRVRAAAESEQ